MSWKRRFKAIYTAHHYAELKTALIVWTVLLGLFADPDYTDMGPTIQFYYLLTYRLIIIAALLALAIFIKPSTPLFKISYPVAFLVVIGFTRFMLFFVYRPDVTNWIVGVIMFQLIGLLMFVPIRFYLAVLTAIYGGGITLATRRLLGSTQEHLIGLFFLLLLPTVLGAATTMRLGTLQRREFLQLMKADKINDELADEIRRRQTLEMTLKELAATDPLTGLYNRREYEILLEHEMERAKRSNAPLSLCIIDLDHFKNVNDRYGHSAGDEALKQTASLLRDNIRSMDVLGRLGGEEFILLLPQTNIGQASDMARRLLDKLSSSVIKAGNCRLQITATIGMSQFPPGDESINGIIRRADAALYRGKKTGRNCVQTDSSADLFMHV